LSTVIMFAEAFQLWWDI